MSHFWIRTTFCATFWVCSLLTPLPAVDAAEYKSPAWRKWLSAPRHLLELPLIPLKRSVIFSERVDLINRLDDLFYNEDRTFGRIPTFSYQGELGTGAGFTLFHTNLFRRKYGGNFSFLYTSPENISVRTSFSTPFFGEFPLKYRLIAHLLYRRDSEESFYVRAGPGGGLIFGDDTVPEDGKNYSFRILEPRVQLNLALCRTFWIRLRLQAAHLQTGEGNEPVVVPPSLEGLGRDLSLLGGGGAWVWDTRDDAARPTGGALIEAGGGAMRQMKAGFPDSYAFSRYFAQAQKFLPLPWGPHRTFLARGFVEKTNRLGNRAVPFYFLPRLDQNNGLRGFDRNRFQNQGAIVFNVEYRYPIWETWDGVFFVDHGQTFSGYDDVRLTAFNRSFGAAINFLSKNDFIFLLQYGRSGDHSQVVFSLQQSF